MKTFWKDGKPSASFVVGAVALLFLIIGYQSALFIRKASVARIVANHDHPDTVYVYDDSDNSEQSDWGSLWEKPLSPPRRRRGVEERSREEKSSRPGSAGRPSEKARKNGRSTDLRYRQVADEIRRANTPRRYENFRFDPNTAGIDDLMRLGFSQKQAQSIDNYRKKGGKFRRKADFAKSFVVADSVFRRLEEYIDIPKIDINKADSAVFETLPGIGKYFASKMVSYREELGGYSYPEQLMDIGHFDNEKFDGLKDLITVGSSVPYPLWTLTEEELARHPYIGKAAAHGIILFRNNSPVSDWTVENLVRNGILENEKGEKLARCRISPPRN